MDVLYENIYEKTWSFGKNRERFLHKLSPQKISIAEKSLSEFLGLTDLSGEIGWGDIRMNLRP